MSISAADHDVPDAVAIQAREDLVGLERAHVSRRSGPGAARAGRSAGMRRLLRAAAPGSRKEEARSRGVSLSDLIERALRGLTLEERQSFSARWRGRFRAARRFVVG
jgi:hypothetical protein